MEQPIEVVNVFDNNGHTADRFTINILFDDGENFHIACSANPSHPLGVWSVGDGNFNVEELTEEDIHIGGEINWESLPNEVKEVVMNYLSK